MQCVLMSRGLRIQRNHGTARHARARGWPRRVPIAHARSVAGCCPRTRGGGGFRSWGWHARGATPGPRPPSHQVLEAAAKADRPIMIQFSEGGSAFYAGASSSHQPPAPLPSPSASTPASPSAIDASRVPPKRPPFLAAPIPHRAGKSLPNKKYEASILGAVSGAHHVRQVRHVHTSLGLPLHFVTSPAVSLSSVAPAPSPLWAC